MRIHIYIQLSCIILIDIVGHYDYSISIYICSNLRLPKKNTAGFDRFLTCLTALRQSSFRPARERERTALWLMRPVRAPVASAHDPRPRGRQGCLL